MCEDEGKGMENRDWANDVAWEWVKQQKLKSLMVIGGDSTPLLANKLNIITLQICESIARNSRKAAVPVSCQEDVTALLESSDKAELSLLEHLYAQVLLRKDFPKKAFLNGSTWT